MSLRLRLALAGAVAILLALGLAALGLSQLFGAHVERRAVAELGVQLDQVIAGLERGPDGLDLARPPADPRFARPYGGLYWQIAEAGDIRRSRSLWDSALDLPADTLGDGALHVHRLPGPDGAELLVLERSITLPARLGGGAVRAAVAMEASGADRGAPRLHGRSGALSGSPGAGADGGGLGAAVGGSAPVARPRRADRRVAHGRAERMGEDWPQELRPVAAEIDDLLSARDAETERARARAADLAHGLKTPLQALMGEAERLRRDGATARAEGIEDTARAMRRTVDRELARARTAARAADASADPALVADRLIAVLRRTPDGAGLEWRQEIPPGLSVALHEADLAEAMGALLENAARHARGVVVLSALREGGRLVLSIADDGPGIPEPGRAALMQRHARADETGSGLGLSIASDIAGAAGGALTLDGAAGGLTARLALPLAGGAWRRAGDHSA
jgi:signal transduction histidine kinase